MNNDFYKKTAMIIIILMNILFCILLYTNSFGQPYITCNPPAIEDNITKYYIKSCISDPNLYDIDPNNRHQILIPIDPNKTIEVKGAFSDPNFYKEAELDGSLKIDLNGIPANLSYSLLIYPCSDKVCGCPSFLSFMPINVPHKIKGLRITKERCWINKYYYIIIQ